eukprot:scaffold8635_cov93-Isochrysis_galbana.AAC.1
MRPAPASSSGAVGRPAWRPTEVLNTVLLIGAIFLLMRQQYSAALGSATATVRMASPVWSAAAARGAVGSTPPQMADRAEAAEAARGGAARAPVGQLCPPGAPRAAAASPAGLAAAFDGSQSSEQRLKQLWRHPRVKHPEWWKEVHYDWWHLLDRRQLARGLAAAGDPARLECLAEKLLDGRGIKLGVIGGSVSFGTTFTTSKSHALFHWKLYQWINATFPLADTLAPAHEHYCGAVPASGPSYMEHCLQVRPLRPASLRPPVAAPRLSPPRSVPTTPNPTLNRTAPPHPSPVPSALPTPPSHSPAPVPLSLIRVPALSPFRCTRTRGGKHSSSQSLPPPLAAYSCWCGPSHDADHRLIRHSPPPTGRARALPHTPPLEWHMPA